MIRGAVLEAYGQAARLLGLDPTAPSRQVGLEFAALDQAEARVSADALVDLLHAAAAATHRPDFALLVGQAYRYSMLGPLGLLVREQPTVRKALEVYERYVKYANEATSVKVEHLKDAAVFQPYLIDPDLQADSMAVDLIMAEGLCLLRGLLGEGWWPELVCFARPGPDDPSPYARFFGQVEFDHDFNGLVIDAASLDQPIPNTDPDTAGVIARYVEAAAVHPSLRTSDQVRELIARLLPTGQCTIDRVALHLGVDRRTIHRRLAAEGHSFTELVDRIRRDLVLGQLRDSNRPLKAIADLLGFSSLSTFSRWYRNAYGGTAREFRGAGRPRAGGGRSDSEA